MRLDPNCPVELLEYELTHDERGVHGFVHLFNLSRWPVRGFDAVFTWRSAAGESLNIPLQSGALSATPHDAFVLPLETGPVPAGVLSALHFVRVDFEGAAPWLGDPSHLIDVTPPDQPSERELSALQRVAGLDAVVRPIETKTYWICACGRANARKKRACARCGRSHREILRLARQFSEAFKPAEPGRDARGAEENAPGDKPETPPEEAPAEKQTVSYGKPAFSHKALRERYLRQRSLLIRRTVTMLTAAVLIALTALAWTWLTGMQQRARDIVPPMKIEETKSPMPT